MSRELPKVQIYTKPDCCLCDIAKDNLVTVSRQIPIIIDEIDITTDELIFEKYKTIIPVVVINEQIIIESKISKVRLIEELNNII